MHTLPILQMQGNPLSNHPGWRKVVVYNETYIPHPTKSCLLGCVPPKNDRIENKNLATTAF